MRSEQEAIQAIERYADTVRRICMLHLKNHADTEDIFQTVFLKYALYPGAFESDAHEKAWIIRVTVNACRDLLKSFFRSRTVSLDDIGEIACTDARGRAGPAREVPRCRLPLLLRAVHRL